MKVQKSIEHYPAKEQATLRVIKDKILEYVQPLIIYCVTCVSTTEREWSCFSHTRRRKEWTFECDLLLVLPNDAIIDETTKKTMVEQTAAFGQVTLFIHPLDYVMQQIKEGKSEEEIRKSWEPKLSEFKMVRKKYLLYEDFE